MQPTGLFDEVPVMKIPSVICSRLSNNGQVMLCNKSPWQSKPDSFSRAVVA